MIKRISVDNSVSGGKYDPEFAQYTKKLFHEFRLGLYIPVISNITAREIQSAPAQVIKTYNELCEIAENIEFNEEAVNLPNSIFSRESFPKEC